MLVYGSVRTAGGGEVMMECCPLLEIDVNSTRLGPNIWNSLRQLSLGIRKPIAELNAKADELTANGAALQRQGKVRSWRHRVLLKKALRIHLQMGTDANEHSLAVLDEYGVVVAWYDRGRSTRGDDVLKHHVSQFYVSTDVATQMPTRHLRAALLEGGSTRRGWRLHHNGVPFWGTTRITPILLGDGRLQGFSHLTHIASGAPLDCSIAAEDRSPPAAQFLSQLLLPGERLRNAEPPVWNAYFEPSRLHSARACA